MIGSLISCHGLGAILSSFVIALGPARFDRLALLGARFTGARAVRDLELRNWFDYQAELKKKKG